MLYLEPVSLSRLVLTIHSVVRRGIQRPPLPAPTPQCLVLCYFRNQFANPQMKRLVFILAPQTPCHLLLEGGLPPQNGQDAFQPPGPKAR